MTALRRHRFTKEECQRGYRAAQAKCEALGWYAAPFEPEARLLGHNQATVTPDYGITAAPLYLNNRASTIYAGSNEIQRNIIAKTVLGL